MLLTIAIIFLLVLGTAFMALAGLGIVRMPDLYSRMHASTKGASLGVGLMLIAAALHFQEIGVSTKALLTVAFVFLTAPVAAHMLGRAAYLRGTEMWGNYLADEAKGKLSLPKAVTPDPSDE